jgi:hypothetical protein
MANPIIAQLKQTIADLRRQRQQHVDALAEIDSVLADLHIPVAEVAAAPKRGRPRKEVVLKPPVPQTVAPTQKPRRRKFKMTSDQFVLSLLDTPKSTSEIVALWKQSGRGGRVDNSLTRLVRDEIVRREPMTDGRGSRYSRASG